MLRLSCELHKNPLRQRGKRKQPKSRAAALKEKSECDSETEFYAFCFIALHSNSPSNNFTVVDFRGISCLHLKIYNLERRSTSGI